MPANKKSTVKKTSRKKRVPSYRIRLTKNTEEFWNFKFTIQTVYWLLIGVGVIGTAIINYNIHAQVNDLLMGINAYQENNEITKPLIKKHDK